MSIRQEYKRKRRAGKKFDRYTADEIRKMYADQGLEYAREEAKSAVPSEPKPVNGNGEDVAAEETLA